LPRFVQQTDWQGIGELLGNVVRVISAVIVDYEEFPIDSWWNYELLQA
jgi:hypothetical protein